MTAPEGAVGAVVVDLAALQSPTSRGRGIARYAHDWAVALEAAAPELVCAYLLDPALPPPGELEALLATGKVSYRGTEALPDRARVLHSLSPLDLALGLDTLWPDAAARRNLLRSATVYDLIPAKDPSTQLADPVDRWRYQVRLEALRAADQLQAISAGVASDLVAVLGVPPSRLVVAGAAPAERFCPQPDVGAEAAEATAALDKLGVGDRFVLYPTGSHPRKNNEVLLAAWHLLPEALRREVRLVLTGDLGWPTANHLRHLADEGGFAGGLVVAGLVDEATLHELYRRAELVCFPSLAEGYGLPVAEAVACGTPVIGSDRSPLDELLPPLARFDPTDPSAIAEALSSTLTEPGRRAELRAATAAPKRWSEVAATSAAALRELATSGRWRPRRQRIAFVSPFPPSESGVARYSARLVEALCGVGLEVDCFGDGPASDQQAPAGAEALYPASRLPVVAPLRGGYDEVVYALGNSHFHLGALRALRERPGVVLAHDVRMTNLYKHDVAQADALPGGLGAALRAMYGDDLPDGLGAGDDLAEPELERYGLLMAREAIAESRRFLVTSRAAAALARVDGRPGDGTKVFELRFAFARPSPSPSRSGDDGPVVAHFGIVDPAKQPFVVLEAFAAARDRWPSARLAFVGPVSEALADAVRERAGQLGIAEAVELAGSVPGDRYAAALAEAAVAVQLRATSNGEASAAVGDCLAAGVPTIVTGIGWARELPGDAVVHVDRHVEPAELGMLIAELLGDERRRSALSSAGRREAATRRFEGAAAALVELAGLGSPWAASAL